MDEQKLKKRPVKITEKALEENKVKAVNARRHKLLQLTSMKNKSSN